MRFAAAALLLCLPMMVAQPLAAQDLARRPSAAQLQELRRWLCPNGGMPVRGRPGRCDKGPLRYSEGRWDQGLAPPDRAARAECPEGTKPVLARGHDDVFRCLPG